MLMLFFLDRKECQVFSRRTAELIKHLNEKDADLKISVNENIKPRRGVFEVTVNGEVVFSLHGMPRPFKKLRETDLEDVADDILSAIEGTGETSSEVVPEEQEVEKQEVEEPKEEVQEEEYEETDYSSEEVEEADSASDYSPPKRSRKKARADSSDYEDNSPKKKRTNK